MGARLRVRATVNGQDPALRTADPNVRRIFRAMQKHGLIVADNGSDLYVTGTFDPRWNNDVLNPAFALLTAADFEVVQLGWQAPASAAVLASFVLLPARVRGGVAFFAVVTLAAPAPAGGISVALASSDPTQVAAPARLTVPAGETKAKVMIPTRPARADRSVTLTATLAGQARSAVLAVTLR
jgi:hypothetical protein